MVSEAFASSNGTRFTCVHNYKQLCRITVNEDDYSTNPLTVSKICDLELGIYKYEHRSTACHYRTAVTILDERCVPLIL